MCHAQPRRPAARPVQPDLRRAHHWRWHHRRRHARDAAMRGLSVALIDKGDFASGTSSRSSRLIHGGVRYLEHGHLRLVFEASAERRRLLRLAPHLVRPLSFTWPVYPGQRLPLWKLAAGLTLYDALSLFRNVDRHRRLRPEAVLEAEPALTRRGAARRRALLRRRHGRRAAHSRERARRAAARRRRGEPRGVPGRARIAPAASASPASRTR